jgi:hypothetical protein
MLTVIVDALAVLGAFCLVTSILIGWLIWYRSNDDPADLLGS